MSNKYGSTNNLNKFVLFPPDINIFTNINIIPFITLKLNESDTTNYFSLPNINLGNNYIKINDEFVFENSNIPSSKKYKHTGYDTKNNIIIENLDCLIFYVKRIKYSNDKTFCCQSKLSYYIKYFDEIINIDEINQISEIKLKKLAPLIPFYPCEINLTNSILISNKYIYSCDPIYMNNKNCVNEMDSFCKYDNNIISKNCKDYMNYNNSINKSDYKFDAIATEYCNKNPDDIFCSCYKKNIVITGDINIDNYNKSLQEISACWNDNCKKYGYKTLNMRNVQCPKKTTLCTNSIQIGDNNTAKSINQYCNVNESESDKSDKSEELTDSINYKDIFINIISNVYYYIFLLILIVLTVIIYNAFYMRYLY